MSNHHRAQAKPTASSFPPEVIEHIVAEFASLPGADLAPLLQVSRSFNLPALKGIFHEVVITIIVGKPNPRCALFLDILGAKPELRHSIRGLRIMLRGQFGSSAGRVEDQDQGIDGLSSILDAVISSPVTKLNLRGTQIFPFDMESCPSYVNRIIWRLRCLPSVRIFMLQHFINTSPLLLSGHPDHPGLEELILYDVEMRSGPLNPPPDWTQLSPNEPLSPLSVDKLVYTIVSGLTNSTVDTSKIRRAEFGMTSHTLALSEVIELSQFLRRMAALESLSLALHFADKRLSTDLTLPMMIDLFSFASTPSKLKDLTFSDYFENPELFHTHTMTSIPDILRQNVIKLTSLESLCMDIHWRPQTTAEESVMNKLRQMQSKFFGLSDPGGVFQDVPSLRKVVMNASVYLGEPSTTTMKGRVVRRRIDHWHASCEFEFHVSYLPRPSFEPMVSSLQHVDNSTIDSSYIYD